MWNRRATGSLRSTAHTQIRVGTATTLSSKGSAPRSATFGYDLYFVGNSVGGAQSVGRSARFFTICGFVVDAFNASDGYGRLRAVGAEAVGVGRCSFAG